MDDVEDNVIVELSDGLVAVTVQLTAVLAPSPPVPPSRVPIIWVVSSEVVNPEGSEMVAWTLCAVVSPEFCMLRPISNTSPVVTFFAAGVAVRPSEGGSTTLKALVVAVLGLPAILIRTLIVWLVSFSFATIVVQETLSLLKDLVVSSEVENPVGS